MEKRYFVISDIHGHYNEMINALEENGYNHKNDFHHLIVIGDLFDRGLQSKEVLEYLYPLSIEGKATIILGNHENFLVELLEGDYNRVKFNVKHNGTGETLNSLSGINIDKSKFSDIREKIIGKYPYILEWIKSFPPYLELGNYIFVHGGINGSNSNWRSGSNRDFVWSRQNDLPPISGKTIVVGHSRIATIRYPNVNYKKLITLEPEAFKILHKKGKIFIDSFVEVSKFINVLILDLE